MAIEVRMAKLSPTMDAGTINRWLKKEGDKVSSGDTLAEVETDKASMPLETFDDGILLKILHKEGANVKVDDLVAVIGKAGEDISAILSGAGSASAAPAKAVAAAGATVAKAAAAATTTAVAAPAPVAHVNNGGRIKVSPLAKKIAAERGVDLRNIQPSGPGGRIIQRDVISAPAGAATAATVLMTAPSGKAEDIPVSNLRQTIAKRLLQSKTTIPHFYLFAEVNVENLIKIREELNAGAEESGVKISVNDLVIKVAAMALAKHPDVNATFNQTSIRRHGDVNIAVAVATDDGLYTPVLRGVDRMSLSAINAGVREAAKKAREKKIKMEDLQGSGFTITNLGMYGVDHFFAIINPPEAAILAVGAIETKPVVNVAGQVVAGKVMNITLSCDHRVVDGAVGAKFLGTLKDLLQHPAKMML